MASKNRPSQVGFSQMYPRLDMGNPHQFRQAIQNVVTVHDLTPEQTRRKAELWYPDVHEAVRKGVRRTGISERHGAAIVAAVSPQMDWSKRNIPAFKELTSMREGDWDVIHRSIRQGGGRRTPEAEALLKGRSISHSSDVQLARAHRLIRGEDPEEVLPRRTSPKVHSFYHNIATPDQPTHVTVDYRAHDIAANRMYPAQYSGRGLESAALASGRPTRYEQFENVYRGAAAARGYELPHTIQAISWMGGKEIEHAGTTRRGQPRVKGVSRKGQPYAGE